MKIQTMKDFEISYELCKECEKPEGSFKGLFCKEHMRIYDEIKKLEQTTKELTIKRDINIMKSVIRSYYPPEAQEDEEYTLKLARHLLDEIEEQLRHRFFSFTAQQYKHIPFSKWK